MRAWLELAHFVYMGSPVHKATFLWRSQTIISEGKLKKANVQAHIPTRAQGGKFEVALLLHLEESIGDEVRIAEVFQRFYPEVEQSSQERAKACGA